MATYYMGDFDYLSEVLCIDLVRNQERFNSCLRAMEKYQSPWWFELRSNPKELARMQLSEPVLLVNAHDFKRGVEEVLGKKINIHDLLDSTRNQKLIDEFYAKFSEENSLEG